MGRIRVAVLMGGRSAEREVSLSTGRQIVSALDPQRYDVSALDAAALQAGPDLAGPAGAIPSSNVAGAAELVLRQVSVPQLVTNDAARPDVVFIALHGRGGEDGTIQGMLEVLGIPYTGSGVLASAVAMDKSKAKKLLRAEDIRVPDWIEVTRGDEVVEVDRVISRRFGYPVIVKPNSEGSTIGCTRVRAPVELSDAIGEALRHDTLALIEPLISGVEITAGLLGTRDPQVLPLIEIASASGFYDFEAKYSPGASKHTIPARISAKAQERAIDYARRSHDALGCSGMSRVDMMVTGDQPYVLEVNTIPGMTPTSLLPEAAAAAGIPFPELLDRLIWSAIDEWRARG